MKYVLSTSIRLIRIGRNIFKRYQLYGFGLRAKKSTSIAWSTSIDSGGGSGRVSIGEGTLLDIGVVIRAYGGRIEIGEFCSVNPYSFIQGAGAIKIGNGVRIGPHCAIVASNHIFSDPNRYIHTQGDSSVGIIIEDDVWLGVGVRVLDGVIIGKGAVVAAGAVVTKSIAPFTIVAGIPAKKIGSRLEDPSGQDSLA